MATLDVTTVEDAKEALNLTATSKHDSELAAWITAVSLMLDQLIGPVVRRTVTERHDGGCGEIFLRCYPLTSITSITEYSGTTATVLAAETNVLKPTNGYLCESYEHDPNLLSGVIARRSGGSDTTFPVGRRNIEVVAVAGRFADTLSVDERARKAAELILMNAWRSQQDSTGVVGEFDVPQNLFPRFAIPGVVRDMYFRELQNSAPVVA